VTRTKFGVALRDEKEEWSVWAIEEAFMGGDVVMRVRR
jgi:hypothetical protein